MRHIKKRKEPLSLKKHRKTPGATYAAKPDWQEALLREQGHICAYCMGRISIERKPSKGATQIKIEHYLPRSTHPKLKLVWRNMLGSCQGGSGKNLHCDSSKGNELLTILNPISRQNSEDLLTYSLSGEIMSINRDVQVGKDLDILKLNHEKLRQFRKDKIDIARERLSKNYAGQWHQQVFDQEIALWSTPNDGKFKPYFKAVVWFLEWMKTLPRYQH